MYIKSEFIDTLLDKINIVTVISEFVELKRSGANLKGLSPFVTEKTPSFVVSPVKEIFKDFASGKGGNVVTFLMEYKQFSYIEAIEFLAQKESIEVQYEKPEYAEKHKKELGQKEELTKVLQSVHKLYIKELEALPDNHPAINELDRRGYSKELIKEWGIGYAPTNYLYDKLYNSGKIREAESLGLVKNTGQPNKYDLYSNRLIYPIFDSRDKIIGLAGRQLSSSQKSKWINPPVDDSNILYKKSTVWFGINRALKTARVQGEMYIVEGYNDVIAFQENGLLNTVAPCGTAIAPSQIDILKKHVKKVNLVLDPDRAGQTAALKYIPEFLKKNIRVDVIELPGLDPDDLCRQYKETVEKDTLVVMLNEVRTEGFMYLMSKEFGETRDAIDKDLKAQRIAEELIGAIPEEVFRINYTKWLASEIKQPIKKVEEWVSRGFEIKENERNKENDDWTEYELPEGVYLKEVIDDIRHYGLFMAKNQIFFAAPRNKDGEVHFHSNSNFQIEYLMHIRDEKYPKKLIRVKNTFNEEIVFDTNSDDLNTLQSFYNRLSGNGNFRFDGNNNDLKALNRYLMDKMGSGIKIDVLGWQHEGFWVWNNLVIDEEGKEIPMTKDGIIVHNNNHYYVPSANRIYARIHKKYKGQKQFIVINNPTPFDVFLHKVKEVHREHSISAVLFAIASLFLDIIEEENDSFPILFLYGPGGSGKDELAAIVQGFVGIPQEAINLEGGVSTAKAQVREFAQFRNGISQLSEYRRGDQKIDGMLKGLWDRRGYKKGNIESDISTDTVEIESSVILTGNEYPSSDALISRLLANEMIKNEFNEQDGLRFNELKDIAAKGISGYANELMKHRGLVKGNYSKEVRKWKSFFQAEMPATIGRIIENYSTIATVYTMFKDTINFPFTQNEMVEYFKECAAQQMRKINSTSVVTRFFDLFISSLRGMKDDRLQVGQVVNVEGSMLYFNWRHTYAKIQRMWYIQHQEVAPSNTSLLSALEKANVISGKKTAYSFSPGQNGNRTSALMIDMSLIEENIRTDIVGSIMAQQYNMDKDIGQTNFFDPPATPEDENIFID